MGNVKFSSVPEMTEFKVPVSWNEKAMGNWLERLPGTELEKSCKQICGVLQALKRSDVKSKLHWLLLKKIMASLSRFESRIESIYLDSFQPLTDEQELCVKWLVWCLLSLSSNFQQLIENCDNKKTKAHLLYHSLSALIEAYQHMATVYTDPCECFWQNCYQIYTTAEINGLENVEIEQNLTINHLFKGILVFRLCDYSQFAPREMKWIFSYLGPYANHLEILRKIKKDNYKGMFALDLKSDREPIKLVVEEDFQHDLSSRYFAPAKLAKKMYEVFQNDHKEDKSKTVNQDILVRIIKTLGLGQTRKFKRTAEQISTSGIIGFVNIRNYLRKDLAEEMKSNKPQSDINQGEPLKFDAAQLELIEEGDELVHQMDSMVKKSEPGKNKGLGKIFAVGGGASTDLDVWNDGENLPEDVDINNFVVINSSAKGYGIGFSQIQKIVKVGELFAFIADHEKGLELGLIRWLNRLSDEQCILGIELIGVATDVVQLKGKGKLSKQTWAIFLPEIKALKQSDTVIFSSEDFNVSDFVTVRKNNKDDLCQLENQINLTSSVRQMALFYL